MTTMRPGLQAAFQGRLGALRFDAAITVPARGVTGVFGPSGCGKTTLLRCIAGLRRLPGRCIVDGVTWQDAHHFRPAHRRPVGYVFQEASLFSHLSVHGNLLYGARRARGVGYTDSITFDDVVALLGLAPLLGRAPVALSGGERQRVAIGRALLSRPRLLLLDEPLSALDQDAKADILPYLRRLTAHLSLPSLYVSHDLTELERLADTLVLMDRGGIRAQGALSDLLADPAQPLLAAPDAAAVLHGTVGAVDRAYGLVRLDVPGGALLVPDVSHDQGAHVRLRVRAADVSLTRERPQQTSILNVLPARIVSLEDAHAGGAHVTVVVALAATGFEAPGPGGRILARITRKSRDDLGLAVGQTIHVQIKGVALIES